MLNAENKTKISPCDITNSRFLHFSHFLISNTIHSTRQIFWRVLFMPKTLLCAQKVHKRWTKDEQKVNFQGNLSVKKCLLTLYEVRFPDKKLPYDPLYICSREFYGTSMMIESVHKIKKDWTLPSEWSAPFSLFLFYSFVLISAGIFEIIAAAIVVNIISGII